MNRMIESIRRDLSEFYAKFNSAYEIDAELETELSRLIHRVVSWYGAVGVAEFGTSLSTQTARFLLHPIFDRRFKYLYYNLMMQNKSNFRSEDIEMLKLDLEYPTFNSKQD